jgi:hypothetical protein
MWIEHGMLFTWNVDRTWNVVLQPWTPLQPWRIDGTGEYARYICIIAGIDRINLECCSPGMWIEHGMLFTWNVDRTWNVVHLECG